jgi:hypothetical protein
MPDAEDLGFEMLPPDDEGVSAEADLEAAAASALEDAGAETAAEDEEPARPFGRTWVFDFGKGRFVRQGGAPAETRGAGALQMWCLMAVHSARYAHRVFSDDFGMEHPEDPMGRLLTDERVAEYAERLQEALLVHDRIVAVENFDAAFDPSQGVLLIRSFDVVTDDEDRIPFDGLTITVEA